MGMEPYSRRSCDGTRKLKWRQTLECIRAGKPDGTLKSPEKMNDMTSSLNWRASEACITAPYPSSSRSLANVKLRLDANESLATDEERRIESVENWDRLTPELLLDIDMATLTGDTRLPVEGIVVSVIVRDRDLNKFEQIAAWPLSDLPQDTWPLGGIHDRFSRAARLDVVVVATPDTSALRYESIPIPKGAVIAAKTFKIRVPSRGFDLPVVLVDPSAMEEKGLDRNTVCFVYWKGEDIQRPPADLIEVWLNKELEDKFLALSSGRAGNEAKHIAQNIAAHVYANVLAVVLSDDAANEEPASLVGVVNELIERNLGMTIDDARHTYREGPSGRAKLMPWCWKLTGADRTFATIRF